MRLLPTCKGKFTPCWLQMAEQRAASGEAPCVRALKEAGALMIGKASCHEAGAGMTGMSLAQGTATNPHDRTRVAGGSSGGSAALVAAGICPFTIGRTADGVLMLLLWSRAAWLSLGVMLLDQLQLLLCIVRHMHVVDSTHLSECLLAQTACY